VTASVEQLREVRSRFEATRGFPLDEFQRRSLDALDAGRSVLVAAPTGSGKTVVAEYAVELALAGGQKAFYTTPLKALSNQKYSDFVRAHGAGRVGLLTGDNSINGDAPVVVMTTEVLRNMIYGASSTLGGLRYVVLDEVHYLQNPYRGAVWEEVIIHLDPVVDLVCLSATVSNAEEFADWIATVRGETEAVIEERRPVELRNLYMVGDRSAERIHLLPVFVGEGDNQLPNPEAVRLDARPLRAGWQGRRPRGRLHAPYRSEVIERLDEEAMLPCIYFIFSRAGCDQAVQQCVGDGLRLTTPEQRAAIREIAEAHVAPLSDDDLRVLDYGAWLSGLEAGFAAHHAGMVPPMKEAVEEAFVQGLVPVVFATETLSLGINMPARTVVIEKLTKFTGDGHEELTPGEYTQLTGRAGRRGIDDLGYAVVLWNQFVTFDKVAGLASKRTYELRSSFRPTYNMAANLVRRYTPDAAHHLLNLSFAQYRANADVVHAESRLDRERARLALLQRDAMCERGDVQEYRALQRKVKETRQAERRPAGGLERLAPGDVILSRGQRIAVLSRKGTGEATHVDGLTAAGKRLRLSARTFHGSTNAIAHIDLPVPFQPRNRQFQREVVDKLRALRATRTGRDREPTAVRRELEQQLEDHPVHACPKRDTHVRLADRAEAQARSLARLERSAHRRSRSLADQFDQVLALLESWRYVDVGGWALTDRGTMLARLYAETDLLAAEALAEGVFDDLPPPALAAVASALTYETRGPTEGATPTPSFPNRAVRERWTKLERLGRELVLAESDVGLPETRPPDPGFLTFAYEWAAGRDLDDVIGDDDVSGGDFVRNVKQLIDLLRQLGDVAPNATTAGAARQAADALFRGVVAASSTVHT
jgi:ATP-dependent RNA helicase HelY